MLKRLVTSLVLVALLGPASLAIAPNAAAQATAPEAAELCREADEEGVLAALGITRGECVNLVKGPASEQSNNFVAALCGIDVLQEFVGATNKGQCIKILRNDF